MTIYGKGCISNYRNCSLCYVWYSVLYRMLTVQAIIAYKQAIDCNPSYARPYLAMAEVYTKKGDKELAMNNFLAAVTLFGHCHQL